jgi:hypothetical protein
VLLKFLRQTGARAFVRSSAVRHDRSVLGDSGKVFFELVYRNSDRFRQHGVRFRPSLRITDVNQHEIVTGFHSPLQFVNGDSQSVSHKEPPKIDLNSRCETADLGCRKKEYGVDLNDDLNDDLDDPKQGFSTNAASLNPHCFTTLLYDYSLLEGSGVSTFFRNECRISEPLMPKQITAANATTSRIRRGSRR